MSKNAAISDLPVQYTQRLCAGFRFDTKSGAIGRQRSKKCVQLLAAPSPNLIHTHKT